jgi:hypothetical protein
LAAVARKLAPLVPLILGPSIWLPAYAAGTVAPTPSALGEESQRALPPREAAPPAPNEAASSKLWPASPVQLRSGATTWRVQSSLKATLQDWARLLHWPAPQFLTPADWPVDVPDSISGAIEDALRILAEGFAKAPVRPRIEMTSNHVLIVSEVPTE